jgi:hypothetical protein
LKAEIKIFGEAPAEPKIFSFAKNLESEAIAELFGLLTELKVFG